jgi:hypothetical protein
MILTQRQLDVLNHIVEDGQTWADNAKEEAHVLAKVARWEAEYDASVLAGNYRNRVERDLDALPPPLTASEQWKVDIRSSPMNRNREDFITEVMAGVADSPAEQAIYDAKIILRGNKPI